MMRQKTIDINRNKWEKIQLKDIDCSRIFKILVLLRKIGIMNEAKKYYENLLSDAHNEGSVINNIAKTKFNNDKSHKKEQNDYFAEIVGKIREKIDRIIPNERAECIEKLKEEIEKNKNSVSVFVTAFSKIIDRLTSSYINPANENGAFEIDGERVYVTLKDFVEDNSIITIDKKNDQDYKKIFEEIKKKRYPGIRKINENESLRIEAEAEQEYIELISQLLGLILKLDEDYLEGGSINYDSLMNVDTRKIEEYLMNVIGSSLSEIILNLTDSLVDEGNDREIDKDTKKKMTEDLFSFQEMMKDLMKTLWGTDKIGEIEKNLNNANLKYDIETENEIIQKNDGKKEINVSTLIWEYMYKLCDIFDTIITNIGREGKKYRYEEDDIETLCEDLHNKSDKINEKIKNMKDLYRISGDRNYLIISKNEDNEILEKNIGYRKQKIKEKIELYDEERRKVRKYMSGNIIGDPKGRIIPQEIDGERIYERYLISLIYKRFPNNGSMMTENAKEKIKLRIRKGLLEYILLRRVAIEDESFGPRTRDIMIAIDKAILKDPLFYLEDYKGHRNVVKMIGSIEKIYREKSLENSSQYNQYVNDIIEKINIENVKSLIGYNRKYKIEEMKKVSGHGLNGEDIGSAIRVEINKIIENIEYERDDEVLKYLENINYEKYKDMNFALQDLAIDIECYSEIIFIKYILEELYGFFEEVYNNIKNGNYNLQFNNQPTYGRQRGQEYEQREQSLSRIFYSPGIERNKGGEIVSSENDFRDNFIGSISEVFEYNTEEGGIIPYAITFREVMSDIENEVGYYIQWRELMIKNQRMGPKTEEIMEAFDEMIKRNPLLYLGGYSKDLIYDDKYTIYKIAMNMEEKYKNLDKNKVKQNYEDFYKTYIKAIKKGRFLEELYRDNENNLIRKLCENKKYEYIFKPSQENPGRITNSIIRIEEIKGRGEEVVQEYLRGRKYEKISETYGNILNTLLDIKKEIIEKSNVNIGYNFSDVVFMLFEISHFGDIFCDILDGLNEILRQEKDPNENVKGTENPINDNDINIYLQNRRGMMLNELSENVMLYKMGIPVIVKEEKEHIYNFLRKKSLAKLWYNCINQVIGEYLETTEDIILEQKIGRNKYETIKIIDALDKRVSKDPLYYFFHFQDINFNAKDYSDISMYKIQIDELLSRKNEDVNVIVKEIDSGEIEENKKDLKNELIVTQIFHKNDERELKGNNVQNMNVNLQKLYDLNNRGVQTFEYTAYNYGNEPKKFTLDFGFIESMYRHVLDQLDLNTLSVTDSFILKEVIDEIENLCAKLYEKYSNMKEYSKEKKESTKGNKKLKRRPANTLEEQSDVDIEKPEDRLNDLKKFKFELYLGEERMAQRKLDEIEDKVYGEINDAIKVAKEYYIDYTHNLYENQKYGEEITRKILAGLDDEFFNDAMYYLSPYEQYGNSNKGKSRSRKNEKEKYVFEKILEEYDERLDSSSYKSKSAIEIFLDIIHEERKKVQEKNKKEMEKFYQEYGYDYKEQMDGIIEELEKPEVTIGYFEKQLIPGLKYDYAKFLEKLENEEVPYTYNYYAIRCLQEIYDTLMEAKREYIDNKESYETKEVEEESTPKYEENERLKRRPGNILEEQSDVYIEKPEKRLNDLKQFKIESNLGERRIARRKIYDIEDEVYREINDAIKGAKEYYINYTYNLHKDQKYGEKVTREILVGLDDEFFSDAMYYLSPYEQHGNSKKGKSRSGKNEREKYVFEKILEEYEKRLNLPLYESKPEIEIFLEIIHEERKKVQEKNKEEMEKFYRNYGSDYKDQIEEINEELMKPGVISDRIEKALIRGLSFDCNKILEKLENEEVPYTYNYYAIRCLQGIYDTLMEAKREYIDNKKSYETKKVEQASTPKYEENERKQKNIKKEENKPEKKPEKKPENKPENKSEKKPEKKPENKPENDNGDNAKLARKRLEDEMGKERKSLENKIAECRNDKENIIQKYFKKFNGGYVKLMGEILEKDPGISYLEETNQDSENRFVKKSSKSKYNFCPRYLVLLDKFYPKENNKEREYLSEEEIDKIQAENEKIKQAYCNKFLMNLVSFNLGKKIKELENKIKREKNNGKKNNLIKLKNEIIEFNSMCDDDIKGKIENMDYMDVMVYRRQFMKLQTRYNNIDDTDDE